MRSGCSVDTRVLDACCAHGQTTTMQRFGTRFVKAVFILALLVTSVAANINGQLPSPNLGASGMQPVQAHSFGSVLTGNIDEAKLDTGVAKPNFKLLGQKEGPWSQEARGQRRLAQATAGTPAASAAESPTPESTPIATTPAPASPTSGATPISTPTVTLAATPSPVETPAATSAPTAVPTASPTIVSTPATTPTSTPTIPRTPSSPASSMTPTPTVAATAAPTPAATPAAPTLTPSATPPPATPSLTTPTPTPSPTLTLTPSRSPPLATTAAVSPSLAAISAETPSPTSGGTPAATPDPTSDPTPAATSATPTTPTTAATAAATPSPTAISTPAATPESLPVITLTAATPTPVAATPFPSPSFTLSDVSVLPSPSPSTTGVPAPGPGPANAPALGPAFAPASGPGTPGYAPAFAPAPEPGTPGGAPAFAPGIPASAPAFAPGISGGAPAFAPGTPGGAPAFAPGTPGFAPASAPGSSGLAGAEGPFALSSSPGLAPAASTALAPGAAPETGLGLFPGAPGSAPALGPFANGPTLGPGASGFATGFAPADSPAGSLLLAPVVAPTGSQVLTEGSMAFITTANSTARTIDPSTGMLVAASTVSAATTSRTIWTNKETFTVRVRSATALTTSNLEASNGDIVSVQATPGAANSYDVAAKSRTNKGKMTLSTIAGAGVLANTITVNVDVTDAQVEITSPQLVTSGTNPTVRIDFGGRVAQLNPLLMYNVTGAERTDVVYDVDNGVVLLTAYVQEDQATDIYVTVDAGVTTSLAGNPNTAASQVVKYRPPSTAVTSVSHTANIVIGATIAASLGSSLLTGATAGISTLFLVNYMQTFYWQSRMAVPHFPENFRQFAEGFSWSGLDVIAPWKKSQSNDLDDNYSSVRATGFPYPPVGVTTSSFNTGTATGSAYFALPNSTAETQSASTIATASRRLTACFADPIPANVPPKRRSLLSVSPGSPVFAPAPAPAGQLAPGIAPAPGPSLAPSAAPAGAPAPEAASSTGRRLLGFGGEAHQQTMRQLLQDTNSTDINSTDDGTLPGVLPGQRLVVTSTGLSTAGDANVTGATAVSRLNQIEDDAMGTNVTNPYKRLLRVLFWLAVLLAVVVALHMAVLAAFLFSRWDPPGLLHFPRPELVVLLISLAAVAQGAASLFTGDRREVAVGVVLVILLPVGFLLAAAWFIWRRLYHASIPQRRAAFILQEDPEVIQEHWAKHNKCTRFLGEFFIGPIRPEGTWQVLKSPDSRFVNKYGALFEDNRGPPMVLRGATYAVDPATGWVNRGKLEPYYGPPLISLGRNRHLYRYQVQGFAKLIGVLRVIIYALLLNGVSSSSSIAQVVALMVCSLIHFCFLRFVEPLCERGELAVALLAEVCDAGVFVCGLILILGQSANDKFRLTIGLVMLGLKGIGLAVAVLYNCFTSIAAAREFIRRYLWPYLPCLSKRPEDKFADLVGRVILQDEHILARKYADKWMVRALGVGLFKRKLRRREVEDTRQLLLTTIANPLARVSRAQKRPPLQESPTVDLIGNNPLSASPFAQPAPARASAQSNRFPVVSAAAWNVPSPDNSFSQPDAMVTSSAVAPQARRGRWHGLVNVFNRPSRSAQQLQQMASHSSGSLPLTGPMLPSIDEGSNRGTRGSNDLDASTAAASANQQWLKSASSPRRSHPAAPSDVKPSSSGRYVPPSPWSSPDRSAGPSVSSSQTASPYAGPFEAAARARTAQAPDLSAEHSPSTARPTAGQSVTPERSVSRNGSGRPGYPVPSPGWTTGIQGMGTTKAARSLSASSSNSSVRRNKN